MSAEVIARTTALDELTQPVCLRCARHIQVSELLRGSGGLGAAAERIEAKRCKFGDRGPHEVCAKCQRSTVAGFYLKTSRD